MSYPQPPPYQAQAHTEPPPKYPDGNTDGYHSGVAGGRGYYQSMPSAGSTTIIVREFGPYPSNIECPYCRCHVQTGVMHTPGALAWLSGGLLCLFGFWPCACIPCCVPECQDVKHYCPHCGQFLGAYTRL